MDTLVCREAAVYKAYKSLIQLRVCLFVAQLQSDSANDLILVSICTYSHEDLHSFGEKAASCQNEHISRDSFTKKQNYQNQRFGAIPEAISEQFGVLFWGDCLEESTHVSILYCISRDSPEKTEVPKPID